MCAPQMSQTGAPRPIPKPKQHEHYDSFGVSREPARGSPQEIDKLKRPELNDKGGREQEGEAQSGVRQLLLMLQLVARKAVSPESAAPDCTSRSTPEKPNVQSQLAS